MIPESITIHSIATPLESVTWSCLDNEAILLNLDSGVYYTLNEVGCESWKLMNATRTLRDIAGELCALYDVEPQLAEIDLLALAEDLQQEQLITMR